MAADTVQAQYETLEAIVQRFKQEADTVQEISQTVARSMGALRDGGWQGQGAQAFFAEMEGTINPAVGRLIEALAYGGSTTQQIAAILQEAEEEAAALFGGEGDGSGGEAGGDAGGAGGAPAEGGGTTPGSNASTLPTPIPTDQVFSDGYMDRLIGSQYQGAGSPELNQAMETLAGNPSPAERDQALAQIAAARGLSTEQVQANYDRYLELRAEAERHADADPNDDVKRADLVNERNKDFMGTTSSLRYGQVVGDAVGVDPVFGAMLNPTGGLVGPGNTAVDLGNDPVGYHGIMHDAAGYLHNYHEKGPGYDYLGRESQRDTGSPFTGQQEGIKYWHDKMGTPYRVIPNPLAPIIPGMPPVLPGWRMTSEAGGWAIGKYQDYKEGGFWNLF